MQCILNFIIIAYSTPKDANVTHEQGNTKHSN